HQRLAASRHILMTRNGSTMKIYVVTAVLGLILSQPGVPQQRKSDRVRDGLVGEVSAVREVVLSSATHQPVEPPGQQRPSTSYYDKSGNLILQLDYVEGRMVRRRTFRHTGPDEVLEKIQDGGVDRAADVVGPNPPPDQLVRHSLKFDGDGNLAEESLYADGG